MRVLYNNLKVPEINQVNKPTALPKELAQNDQKTSFGEILQNKINDESTVRFSKHANMRLLSREIDLSNEQIERVEEGVNRAKEKGIRDSLVFVDNVALVVNVQSKTVITAMNNANENVFTNIDGAVIV